MIKRYLLAALLCAAGTAQGQEVLKLGAVVTLSGPGAAWGQGMLYGAELAADDVNAKGGLDVGGKKYRVELVAYDDKYQANEAVTAMNRLVYEDKVKFIIGPTGSAPVLALAPITEKNKVLLMMLAFTSKALAPDKPFSFRPVLTSVETAQPMIDWVTKVAGAHKVGGLFVNDESGQQQYEYLSKAYQKAGYPFAAYAYFERDRVDMVPLITGLMAKGVDAIELNGISPATAGLIAKQARELGFKGMFIRSGGPATAEIVAVAGPKAVEGMIVYTQFDPGNPAVKAYADRYQAKYKKTMNGFSPSFYDGTHMLLRAISDAGTVSDSDKVRTALIDIKDYRGILGTSNWTGQAIYGSNQQIDAPFFLSKVHDGKEAIAATCTLAACR
ncbi:ABC transporter substrate-binding protein [Achromobacter aloeverae]|uniref:ABC transporter substrate-binding protein n=1 Tax=Achromobacter aloeverae TaxID=1750518 RepID=UPI0018653A67|nr:ABC transporter substrate-binding protein [Achromobacter aloeverae]